MDLKYFNVTVNTAPFSSDSEREVGNYINKDLATKVWHFLYQVNDNKNIEIRIREYVDKCVVCNSGIRLEDTPNGRITMINDKLDRKEYLRLINIDIPKNDFTVRYLNIEL